MSSIWRWIAIAVLTPLGLLYALPNLYPAAPGVQLGWSAGAGVNADELVAEVEQVLDEQGIRASQTQVAEQAVTLVLDDSASQLKARDILAGTFSDRAVVALNLVDQTPDWLSAIGASAMKLGLDLRGGVHFLLAIDRKTLLNERLAGRIPEIRAHVARTESALA